jgi:hypothetical protein
MTNSKDARGKVDFADVNSRAEMMDDRALDLWKFEHVVFEKFKLLRVG